jgi:hypothetical protein
MKANFPVDQKEKKKRVSLNGAFNGAFQAQFHPTVAPYTPSDSAQKLSKNKIKSQYMSEGPHGAHGIIGA